jgi:hypothetical protein
MKEPYVYAWKSVAKRFLLASIVKNLESQRTSLEGYDQTCTKKIESWQINRADYELVRKCLATLKFKIQICL